MDTRTSLGQEGAAASPVWLTPVHDRNRPRRRPCDICRIFRSRMERLGPADLEQVLQFLGELASIESEEPFPRELLAGLRRLVPCDVLTFCELDRVHELELGLVEDPPWEGGSLPCSYWEIRDEHPVCHHHEVSGDF